MAERNELASAVADELERRGVAEAVRLADLMRAEQNLVDALRVVRNQTAALVRASQSARAEHDDA